MANDSTHVAAPLFVGMDVHQETVALAVAAGDGGEPRFLGSVPNTPQKLRKRLLAIGPMDQLRCCYEAGPTGYSTWRLLNDWGIACTVVAPSLIPKKPGDRIKTDRRDAEQLARLHRMGDLTAVWVPTPAHEALRDLCRAREAAKRDLGRARHRLLKLLARHGQHGPIGTGRWTRAYRAWLAELRLEHPDHQYVLEEHRQQFAEAEARLARVTARVKTAVQEGPFTALLQALQCLKGVGPITAVTWVAELGDLTRFRRPRMLMGYSGLTPTEYSSGGRVQRGHITKCGNSHVRFVTIESAWHARWAQQPVSRALRKRREGQPEAIVHIAERAQQRTGQRYRALLKRGKTSGQAATAVARELLGFVWAIGQVVAQTAAAAPGTPAPSATVDAAAAVAA